MSDTTNVAQARQILEEALSDAGSPPRQAAALEAFFGLFTALVSMPGGAIRQALAQTAKREGGLNLHDEAALVLSLMPGLKEHFMQRFHLLLRVLHPRWMNGGELMLRGAPPFDALKDDLLAALDCGIIDFEGFAAVLIGRYGPDARSVLPELLERLKKHRTDCSKAPGLTWAVYMIGGVSPPVREVLLEVARNEDSCPHSRPLALEILQMNDIPLQ